MGEFRLLNIRNVYVSFDWYTPRPHLVILPAGGHLPEYNTKTSLDEYGDDLLMNVIQAAQKVTELVGPQSGPNQPVTLSVHRGCWVNSKEFHAHVCVDKPSYFRLYRQHEIQIKKMPGWPDSKRTRQWKGKTYEESVEKYPGPNKYFEQDVAAISRTPINQPPLTAVEVSGVAFHGRFARIGFRGAADTSEAKLVLLKRMEEFATARHLAATSVKGDDNWGCHLCVSFGGEFDGFGEHGIYGYIQVTGCMYYSLLPVNRRTAWFEAFKRSDEQVLT